MPIGSFVNGVFRGMSVRDQRDGMKIDRERDEQRFEREGQIHGWNEERHGWARDQHGLAMERAKRGRATGGGRPSRGDISRNNLADVPEASGAPAASGGRPSFSMMDAPVGRAPISFSPQQPIEMSVIPAVDPRQIAAQGQPMRYAWHPEHGLMPGGVA